MTTERVQVGAVGVVIIVTITEDGPAVDVSAVTTKQLVFKKPDGSTVTKTATNTTDGTDGKIQYTTESGFLDGSGTWRVQGYVVWAGGFDGKSEPVSFVVGANL